MRRTFYWLVLCVVLAAVGWVQAFPGSGAQAVLESLDDTYKPITHQVFYYVSKKYVEPDRAEPRPMLEGAFRQLETQYPEVLIRMEEGGDRARVQVDEAEKMFDLQEAGSFSSAADLLNRVLEFVADQLGDEVDRKELYYAALNGALDRLDPHSNVFSPKLYKEFMIGTRGSFGGIGFVFGIRDGDMTIITPIEDTPAFRGGLRSGDRILYIDGEPTINMAVDIAASKMRGEPGTQVTLTLARDAWPEPKAITFTREIIHVESVESHVLNADGDSPVLYAKVKNFQKDTTQQLKKAVRNALKEPSGLAGIILDLRNNPGGLLEQAIALSDGFMDQGTIVSTRGPEPDANSRSEARADKPISDLPLIVLINQGSASASEIVSGALKSSRALLIGQKTFGKGSVQKLFPLTEGGALKLTVAQYLTPGDISIQSIGIQPDIAVYAAQIEEGRVRLGPPPDHVKEADLDNAFNEWGNASGKPLTEIQYYEAAEEESEEDERSFAELSKDEKQQKIAEDFQVRLARKIFAALGQGMPATRDRLIAASQEVLDGLRREETDKIRVELSALGVDWSDDGGDREGARLQMVPPQEVKLVAGSTAEVTLGVKNTGSQTAYRVWGRTESDNPLLSNMDFAFGSVAPGETRQWTAKIEVPKSFGDRWDTYTLHLRAANREEAGDGAGAVRTVSIAKPDFAYSYEMSDENPAEPSRSGDGVLDIGERVRLVLEVRNRGDASSEAAEANIRADEKEELYLEQARYKFERLEANQRQQAPMSFRLVKAGDNGDVMVGVSVTDRDYGAFMSDNLTFRLGEKYPAKQDRVPPQFVFEESPTLHTEADRITMQLKVVDDETVVDFYAYLGDKKIRYLRNKQDSNELPLLLDVPLEMGANRLQLFARDQKDLRGSRTLQIFRGAVQSVSRADTP